MKQSFYRTAMLLGEGAEEVLASAHAAVFGVGGVGGSGSTVPAVRASIQETEEEPFSFMDLTPKR